MDSVYMDWRPSQPLVMLWKFSLTSEVDGRDKASPQESSAVCRDSESVADGGLSSQILYEPLNLTASVVNIPTAGGAGYWRLAVGLLLWLFMWLLDQIREQTWGQTWEPHSSWKERCTRHTEMEIKSEFQCWLSPWPWKFPFRVSDLSFHSPYM